jgi:outer membrane protein OmpA-like peptidoglycan-associated protein
MRKIACLLALFSILPLFSQEYSSASKRAIRNFEKAREYFVQQQDEEAEVYLQKAVEIDTSFVEAWFMLAQIYLDKQETAMAAAYYLRGVRADPDEYAAGYLKVAEMEYSSGQYHQARRHLDQWREHGFTHDRSVARAEKLETNIDFAIRAISDPVPFNPESLGDAVNSEQYEYWPSLSVDEQKIFFTVLGPPNPDLAPSRLQLQEDFYFAVKEGEQWVGREYLGPPVNTNTNEGAQSITADGKYLYFTSCNRPNGHGLMCDLYVARIDANGNWTDPLNLGDVVNTRYSEKHPSISADGRILYFTSNRPGGKGEYDLWMTIRNGDYWTKPVNLGDSINTPGIEQSPFIHPDQQSLYFSSDGWPGLGKGDVFVSRLQDDGHWSTPENLGYPINTHNEEMGFVVNAGGNRAYYSTNRREGSDTDIYTFDMPEKVRPLPVSYITGRVYDARNMKGLEALFQLIDLETGNLVMESVSGPKEGDYFVSLPAGTSYAFNVSMPGYLFYSDHFEIDKGYSKMDPFRKDIPMEPIMQGRKIVLNNIFFDTDSHLLQESSKVELDKIYELLVLNPGLRIEISGHTDNTGTPSYNMELSEKRAEEVVHYLEEKGIGADRLTARGYGEEAPVADNSTEEGRARNRRTELKVL